MFFKCYLINYTKLKIYYKKGNIKIIKKKYLKRLLRTIIVITYLYYMHIETRKKQILR